jgi:hypothetical protein
MIAIQLRHCVPDEADVLVTDTFQRAELAKGFGTKRAEVQICRINPIKHPQPDAGDDLFLLNRRNRRAEHLSPYPLPVHRHGRDRPGRR